MIAVAVTTHDKFMPHLEATIESVETQTRKPDHKLLYLDGGGLLDAAKKAVSHYKGWHVFACDKCGNPNPNRHAAWRYLCDSHKLEGRQWLHYLDGDDCIPPGYLAAVDVDAGARCGAQYPSLCGMNGESAVAPPYSFWSLRRRNYVPTPSVWSLRALKEANAWGIPTDALDDYSTALAVTRLGFELKPLQAVFKVDQLGERHHLMGDGKGFKHCWNARRFAAITLFRGCDAVLDAFMQAAYRMFIPAPPPMFTWFWWIDPQASKEFRKSLHEWRETLGGIGVDVVMLMQPAMVRAGPEDKFDVQRRVVKSYNVAFQVAMTQPGGCDWFLLWEDDMLMPPNALRDICKEWEFGRRMAAISATYCSRNNKPEMSRLWHPDAKVVASLSKTRVWHCNVAVRDVPFEMRRVNMVAGGFTLINPGYLVACLPLEVCAFDKKEKAPIGWDGDMSHKLLFNERGTLWLHGNVRAEHRWYDT